MAQSPPSPVNLDTLSHSQSNISIKSGATADSRSTTSSRFTLARRQKRRGVLGKIGSGFQSMFRRFSRTNTSLTEMKIKILSATTNFSQEEVLEWHEKFLADYPNGYMTRKQFISTYKSLCPKGDAERFARHVFRAFDLDKSNTVDFDEFMVGLSMTSATSSAQTKLEWTFHLFDIDGNGLLTRRECLEVIEPIVRFNLSLQGDISSLNMEQTINTAKRSMMKIFDNVLDNRTDKITMPQFVQACLKDEFISQLLAPGAVNSSASSGASPLTNSA